MTEWRTIDSAPKDGTEILLWGMCERDGSYYAADTNLGWWYEDMWHTRQIDEGIDPTHWMPLPPPPSN